MEIHEAEDLLFGGLLHAVDKADIDPLLYTALLSRIHTSSWTRRRVRKWTREPLRNELGAEKGEEQRLRHDHEHRQEDEDGGDDEEQAEEEDQEEEEEYEDSERDEDATRMWAGLSKSESDVVFEPTVVLGAMRRMLAECMRRNVGVKAHIHGSPGNESDELAASSSYVPFVSTMDVEGQKRLQVLMQLLNVVCFPERHADIRSSKRGFASDARNMLFPLFLRLILDSHRHHPHVFDGQFQMSDGRRLSDILLEFSLAEEECPSFFTRELVTFVLEASLFLEGNSSSEELHESTHTHSCGCDADDDESFEAYFRPDRHANLSLQSRARYSIEPRRLYIPILQRSRYLSDSRDSHNLPLTQRTLPPWLFRILTKIACLKPLPVFEELNFVFESWIEDVSSVDEASIRWNTASVLSEFVFVLFHEMHFRMMSEATPSRPLDVSFIRYSSPFLALGESSFISTLLSVFELGVQRRFLFPKTVDSSSFRFLCLLHLGWTFLLLLPRVAVLDSLPKFLPRFLRILRRLIVQTFFVGSDPNGDVRKTRQRSSSLTVPSLDIPKTKTGSSSYTWDSRIEELLRLQSQLHPEFGVLIYHSRILCTSLFRACFALFPATCLALFQKQDQSLESSSSIAPRDLSLESSASVESKPISVFDSIEVVVDSKRDQGHYSLSTPTTRAVIFPSSVRQSDTLDAPYERDRLMPERTTMSEPSKATGLHPDGSDDWLKNTVRSESDRASSAESRSVMNLSDGYEHERRSKSSSGSISGVDDLRRTSKLCNINMGLSEEEWDGIREILVSVLGGAPGDLLGHERLLENDTKQEMNPWYWRERASADLKSLSRDEDGNTSSGSGGGLGGCSSLWIAPSSHMLLCGPSLMSVVCAIPRTSAISPMMCIDGSSEPGCFRDISSFSSLPGSSSLLSASQENVNSQRDDSEISLHVAEYQKYFSQGSSNPQDTVTELGDMLARCDLLLNEAERKFDVLDGVIRSSEPLDQKSIFETDETKKSLFSASHAFERCLLRLRWFSERYSRVELSRKIRKCSELLQSRHMLAAQRQAMLMHHRRLETENSLLAESLRSLRASYSSLEQKHHATLDELATLDKNFEREVSSLQVKNDQLSLDLQQARANSTSIAGALQTELQKNWEAEHMMEYLKNRVRFESNTSSDLRNRLTDAQRVIEELEGKMKSGSHLRDDIRRAAASHRALTSAIVSARTEHAARLPIQFSEGQTHSDKMDLLSSSLVVGSLDLSSRHETLSFDGDGTLSHRPTTETRRNQPNDPRISAYASVSSSSASLLSKVETIQANSTPDEECMLDDGDEEAVFSRMLSYTSNSADRVRLLEGKLERRISVIRDMEERLRISEESLQRALHLSEKQRRQEAIMRSSLHDKYNTARAINTALNRKLLRYQSDIERLRQRVLTLEDELDKSSSISMQLMTQNKYSQSSGGHAVLLREYDAVDRISQQDTSRKHERTSPSHASQMSKKPPPVGSTYFQTDISVPFSSKSSGSELSKENSSFADSLNSASQFQTRHEEGGKQDGRVDQSGRSYTDESLGLSFSSMMFPHDSALDASPGPILRQLLPDFHDQERKRLSRESSFDVGNYIPSRTPSAIGNVESEKTSSPVQDEMPSRATVESSSQRYSMDALSRASPSSEVKEVKNEVRSTGKTLDTIGSLSPLSSANRERSDSNSSSRNDLEDSMFRYRNVASLRSSGGGLSGHQSSSSSETSSPVSPLIGSVDVSIGTVRSGPHPMVSYPSQDDVDVDIQDQDNDIAISSSKSRLSSPRQLSGDVAVSPPEMEGDEQLLNFTQIPSVAFPTAIPGSSDSAMSLPFVHDHRLDKSVGPLVDHIAASSVEFSSVRHHAVDIRYAPSERDLHRPQPISTFPGGSVQSAFFSERSPVTSGGASGESSHSSSLDPIDMSTSNPSSSSLSERISPGEGPLPLPFSSTRSVSTSSSAPDSPTIRRS